jgi:ferredoxin
VIGLRYLFKDVQLLLVMASVKVGENSMEIPDGDLIRDAAEALGIPFSCKEGVCGSCLSNVKSGKENLMPLSQAEKDYGLVEGGGQRLCCQAKIKSGSVEVESGY